MSTVSANCGMATRRFNLDEGSLVIRMLRPVEVAHLHQIEAENQSDPTSQSDPTRTLARYMPLIKAAVVQTAVWNTTTVIPADMSHLEWLLSCTTSDNRELWAMVRGLYELTKIPLPAEVVNHA